jgi:hypothetical protein
LLRYPYLRGRESNPLKYLKDILKREEGRAACFASIAVLAPHSKQPLKISERYFKKGCFASRREEAAPKVGLLRTAGKQPLKVLNYI